MASSRWKRFAFFERHAQTLPSDVLEDLIPTTSSSLSLDAARRSRSIRSLRRVAAEQASMNDSVSLVVTTAALPLHSKKQETETPQQGGGSEDALEAMWSSLTACTSPQQQQVAPGASPDETAEDNKKKQQQQQQPPPLVLFPSQAPVEKTTDATSNASGDATRTSVDGLVLVFCASRDSELVHCLDVTVRCNPPGNGSTSSGGAVESAGSSSSIAVVETVVETATAAASTGGDYDSDVGWRGYFAPFRINSNNNYYSSQQQDETTIVGLAACRSNINVNNSNHKPLYVACITDRRVVVWEDPHLQLSCRRPFTSSPAGASAAAASTTTMEDTDTATTGLPNNNNTNRMFMTMSSFDGNCRVVDICPGFVAVGTDAGAVLVYSYSSSSSSSSVAAVATGKDDSKKKTGTTTTAAAPNHPLLRTYLRIPPPPGEGVEVVSVKLAVATATTAAVQDSTATATARTNSVFVAYRVVTASNNNTNNNNGSSSASAAAGAAGGGGASIAGVVCYDMPTSSSSSSSTTSTAQVLAPSARHDLDGRYVGSASLVDAATAVAGTLREVTVARPDGLYSYSRTERTGVAPIDGTKLALCLVPPPIPAEKTRHVGGSDHHHHPVASGYALVASTDTKSGRDVVDIYDATNKLVAFHLLLSPGHRAVRAAGTTTFPTVCSDGSVRGGRSSAVILTSGGSLITLTEKLTTEKISLLVQKNLYSAAIVVAYADPSYEAASITSLYRQYAEHLYRKGDFSGAIDQYCHTIGSLESSHVIFRYLDAPKIPLLVKYLERLRARELATPVHNELLRTCYLKLNDTEAADAIAASVLSSVNNKASMASILANLSNNPKEALATICSLDHPQAAQILVIHGASLARVLARETAGVVIALCLGTYSPKALAEAALIDPAALKRMIETHGTDDQPKLHDPYPFHLFASAFIENPKMLRLILTHCNRNRCHLTPSLRRTLLELTLAEWNQAKRVGDLEAEKMRHKEAIAALTDSHCREIGDYDALVIVQLAGFQEGELLLYERLQMTPMLLERYAKDGSEKSRRQMLAMSQSEPEILADVLGHFVEIASEKLKENRVDNGNDDGSEDDEAEDMLEDIREALVLARRQGVLPPARVARILAGEGTGQFSSENSTSKQNQRRTTVPLSVALDYVGTILDESRKEMARLKSEVEEYNQLCNSMEREIDSLLRASHALPSASDTATGPASTRLDIDELYSKVLSDETGLSESISDQPREEFWRDMNQSEDTFDTIARFFAKGVIS